MNKYLSPVLLVVLALATFCAPAVLRAQTTPDAWETYDRFDGLVGHWIFDTVQTPDAALWFGTDEGISRFDGSWRAFDRNDGLPAGAVRTLLIDSEGTLWAGTSMGVARWDGAAWQVLPFEGSIQQMPIYSLVEDGDQQLWAGGASGLYRWHPDGEQWLRMGDAPATPIWQLALDGDGALWLATGNQVFRRGSFTWIEEPLLLASGDPLTDKITVLAPSAAGGLWIGTDGSGLAHLRGKRSQWYGKEEGLPGMQIMAVGDDSEGATWVGTNGKGLARLKNDSLSHLTVSDGLAADSIGDIYEDSDGILWFGTVAGITRLDNRTWDGVQGAGTVPRAMVADLKTDPEGRLWAGTVGGGLYAFENGSWQQVTLDQHGTALPTDYVEAIFFDDVGDMWIGTHGAGVIRRSNDDLTQWTTDSGLSGNDAVDFAQTADGRIWVATLENGLNVWDGQSWRQIGTEAGLISDSIRTIFVDDQGRLWVGTDIGVSLLEGDTWRSLGAETGLAASEITGITQATDGSIWLASWGGGVSRYQNGEWTIYDGSDGQLAPGVEAIWADPESDVVWFGTVSGLSAFDGNSWQNFGAANGVSTGRIYALEAGMDEGLYLGTSNGILRYRPDATAPRVEVMAVNGAAPASVDKLSIAPEKDIAVLLAGSDLLTANDDLFYLYRIKELEGDWQVTRSDTLSFPPIPAGDYTLEVIARDTAFNYSQPAIIPFTVGVQPLSMTLPLLGELQSQQLAALLALCLLLLLIVAYAIWSTTTRMALRKRAVERRFNPYIAGSPIREGTMFFGRENTLKDMETALYRNSLLVHGERRIGKTSLLYQLQHRLQIKNDPEFEFFPVYVDLEGAPEDEFFHRLMEGVLESLGDGLRPMPGYHTLAYHQLGPYDVYDDRALRRDMRATIEYLIEACERQPRLVFMLDEADILNTYSQLTQQQFRRILQDTFAKHAGAIVTGVHVSRVWDRVESPWYNMFIELEIDPFDRNDAYRLIQDPVAGFYKWESRAVEYIWMQSKGRPHRIQQVCLDSIYVMLDDKRRNVTLADAQKAYQQVVTDEHFEPLARTTSARLGYQIP